MTVYAVSLHVNCVHEDMTIGDKCTSKMGRISVAFNA